MSQKQRFKTVDILLYSGIALVALAVMGMLAVFLATPSNSSPSATVTPEPSMAQNITLVSGTSGEQILRVDSATRAADSNGYGVVVRVSITAIGKGVNISPDDFGLVDENKVHYVPSYHIGSYGILIGAIQKGELAPGDTRQGPLVFYMPKYPERLDLVYATVGGSIKDTYNINLQVPLEF